MTRCKILGLTLIALLLTLGAAPAFADEVAPAPAFVPGPIVPAQPGCAPALDLAATLSGQGQLCPATAPESATPEFMARPPRLRTCVCSCGFPCETDADCGPGGNCGPGITCC